MTYDNLGDRPIEEVLNEVKALASVASQTQVQSVAALGALLTIELSRGLEGLSGSIFTAKKQLVETTRLADRRDQERKCEYGPRFR